jgi:hypothetical protein
LEIIFAVFPGLGWREARHKKFHGFFSKAWNFAPEIFQGLETAPTLAG